MGGGMPPDRGIPEEALIACGFDAEASAVDRFLYKTAERYRGKPEFDESFFSS